MKTMNDDLKEFDREQCIQFALICLGHVDIADYQYDWAIRSIISNRDSVVIDNLCCYFLNHKSYMFCSMLKNLCRIFVDKNYHDATKVVAVLATTDDIVESHRMKIDAMKKVKKACA